MNRANRIMWSVIGVVLMALGVCGALISLGYAPNTNRDVTLWTNAMNDRWHRWGVWAPAVTALAVLVIAIAGFALITVELRRRSGRNVPGLVFTVPVHAQVRFGDRPDPIAGKTRVSGSTLRRALQHDLLNHPRIKHAAVRMTGRSDRPQLHIHLDLTRSCELLELQSHVADAVARFRAPTTLEPSVRETVVNVP